MWTTLKRGLGLLVLPTVVWAGSAEYFWDTEPVAGGGNPLALSAGEAWVLGQEGVPELTPTVSSLSSGVHRLGYRVQDGAGLWSETIWLPVEVSDTADVLAAVEQWPSELSAKQMVAAEYFWDTDPGTGGGTAISGADAEAFILGQDGVAAIDVNVSALAAGTHRLGWRAKDQPGRWSAVSWLPVEVEDATGLIAGVQQWPGDEAGRQLVAAEYFWEEDPGKGLGTAVSWAAVDSAVLGAGSIPPLDVDVTGLANGAHRLGYRVRSAAGTWSSTVWLGVQVETGFTRLNALPAGTGTAGAAAVAWPDVDGDGRPDLFLTGNGPDSANVLLHNNGDGTFASFAGNSAALSPVLEGAPGTAWADFDNDGRIDVFLPSAKDAVSTPGRLVRNLADGFAVVASSTLGGLSGRWFGGAWADFDRDGRVDLVLPNFLGTGGTRLLRNLSGGFSDVTPAELGQELFGARQAAWGDFDNDGDADLLVTADAAAGNALFRNDGASGFTRMPGFSGFTGRGIAWADFDNDGWLDVVVGASGAPAARLFRNRGDGLFNEVVLHVLVGTMGTDAMPAWLDFDADGWLDLVVPTTGGVVLLRNDRQDSFDSSVVTQSLQSPDGAKPVAAAVGDFNDDGFPDVFVAQDAVRAGWLFQNPGTTNHWLKVRLQSDLSNGSAIGARIEVTAVVGGTNLTQTRVISGGDGGSQSALEALFGLGESAVADQVRVKWPSGITRSLSLVSGRQAITITELPEVPEISEQPADTVANAGTTFSLNVRGVGRGQLAYQWYRNAQPLPGATNSTITLTDVHPAESGTYTVVISNAGGSTASTPAIVRVVPLFQFTRQLSGPIATDVSNAQEANWVDYDGDGDLDLFLVCINAQSLLYRNEGAAGFSRVNAGPLTQDVATWQSAAWGDYNGDGRVDAVVANHGASPVLFLHNSDGTFVRLSPPPLNSVAAPLRGIFSVDYDRDGSLDLLQLIEGRAPYLFRGDGAGGFSESAALAGLIPAPNYGGAWADYDDNGFPDLYVATYEAALPALLRNRGPAGFIQDATGPIVTEDGRSTTSAWADYDNDGDLDLAVGNFDAGAVNTSVLLYRNEGGGAFTRVPGANFPQHARRVYGLSWGDLDNDGDLDLYVACNQENSDLLYHNNGDGTFTLLNGIGEFGALVNSGGESTSPNWVDYDQDGRLDLSVANAAGNLFLFHNESLGLGNWLEVRCLNAAGVEEPGVVVRATATVDGRTANLRRDLNGGGFHSTEPLLAHFGLGDATNVATLKIEWPRSGGQTLTNVAINRLLTVEEAPDAPFIAKQPQGITVPAGTNVVVKAAVVGAAPLSAQWFRNGQPVVSATNATLTLTNVQPRHAGAYVLVISNAVGTVTSQTATLVVETTFTRLTNSVVEGTTGATGYSTSLVDFDDDGFLDITFADRGGSRMFRNEGNGVFAAAVNSVVGVVADLGVWGDYDNDGLPDLFLGTASVGGVDYLFHNEGHGKFASVSAGDLTGIGGQNQGASWADFDNDGWLDIAVGGGWSTPIRFFRSNAGVSFSTLPEIPSVVVGGTAAGDFDNDGDADLVAVGGSGLMLRNDRTNFSQIVASPADSLGGDVDGVTWGDYDNDGDLDLVLVGTGFTMPTRLFRNDGTNFAEIGQPSFPFIREGSVGADWGDYDNDGWLDLFVSSATSGNWLLHNDAAGGFTLVTNSPVTLEGNTDGGAWGDLDRDGFLDLVVSRENRIYQNQANSNTWLGVRCSGQAANRLGIGAKVRIQAEFAGAMRWQLREISGGSSIGTQGPLEAHFGLGDATNVATLRVEWPSGRVTEMTDVAVNQFLTVEELPAGTPVVRVNGNYSLTDRHQFLSHDPVTVSLHSSLPRVFYTTDGIPADFLATPYVGPFSVNPGTAIHAVAYSEDFSVERPAAPVEVVFLPSFTLTNTTPGGGGVVFDPPAGPYASNRVVRVIATNAPGWNFLRWEGDLAGTNPTNVFAVTSSKTFRAVFGTPVNTVVTGGAGNGSVALEPADNVVPYGATTRVMALPAAGKYFARWSVSGSGLTTLTNSPLAFTVTNAAPTVTALFATLSPGNRTLTLRVEGQGSFLRSPAAGFYVNNTPVTLTAVPDAGWSFDAWSGDAAGSANPLVVTLDANKVVTGRFAFTGIVDPPVIVAEPQDAERLEGQSVALTVGVTGSAPLAYQWWKGTTRLDGATATTLNLANLQLGDTGGYLAVITNAAGSVTSRVAQLTVTLPPNVPPVATLLSPVATDFFRVPTNIVLLARGTDADGLVKRMDFLANGTLLGSSEARSSSNTFTFSWTNPPAGVQGLVVRAMDDRDGTGSSVPVDVTVLPPEITTFNWAQAAQTVTETNGILRLRVVKSGAGAGSVSYSTKSTGALLDKDYRETTGRLEFGAGESEQFAEIRLVNEYIPDGPKTFEVTLGSVSEGAQIGPKHLLTVTILDDDAGLEHGSFLSFIQSNTRAGPPGELQVFTEPLTAFGQWRLPWEPFWRNGGEVITNLDAGTYPVEFRPLVGYRTPEVLSNAVAASQRSLATNTYELDPLALGGSLRVDLGPLPSLLGDGIPGWRLAGDAVWRNSGETVPDVAAGLQVVEFRPVEHWQTPPSFTVLIQPETATTLPVEYARAEAPPSGASTPAALSSYANLRGGQTLSQRQPLPMAGQLRTPTGFGSGIAVRERVVLTAAHVLFSGVTNAVDASSIEWFHERHVGTAGFEPRPLRAVGYYIHTNYLSARIAESELPGWQPGQSTPRTQEWDVAAIYFSEPVARGGQTGYLLSDASPNEWLGSSREKLLLGYPLAGTADGRMHRTEVANYVFSPVPGATRVFSSASFYSFPGNSGGPLCVRFVRPERDPDEESILFPAAVYLGNYGGESVVRAIDSDVASLINRAASSAETGLNFVGGGAILPGNGTGAAFSKGSLKINLQPMGAQLAGAGWRLQGETNYRASGTKFSSVAGTFTVEYRPVPGFQAPSSHTFTFNPPQESELTRAYLPVGPIFPPVADQTIPEQAPWQLQLAATHSTVPTPPLTFALVDGPVGLTVSGAGLAGWTPTEAQGPSTNVVIVRVSDGVAGVTNSFRIIVTEGSQPPVFVGLTNATVPELAPYAQMLNATDADLPAHPLGYTLVSGPAGSGVTNGVFGWIPSEAQGPSTNEVRVAVSDGTASVTNAFTVTVTEVNRPPVPAAVADQFLDELGILSRQLEAADGDLPKQPLLFTLLQGPAGMTVSPAGVVGWVAAAGTGGTTNFVSVSVTDGIASANSQFRVVVRPAATGGPELAEVRLNPAVATLGFVLRGTPGTAYQLELTTDFSTWAFVRRIVLEQRETPIDILIPEAEAGGFYRVRLVAP